MIDLETRLRNQIIFLDNEQQRVKEAINQNGFDCTTAPYVIMKRYRNELKEHIRILRENLNFLLNDE